MLDLLFATIPVAGILILSEFLWRKKIVKGERARKFIHILAGVWIAFWPFYIPFTQIFFLGCLALLFLLYSRVSPIFHAVYAVRRKTYGELFFALAIIACSLIAKDPWIFTVSILFLSIADGGAAVAGRLWGRTTSYLVFNNKNLRKSVIGTAAYLVLAYVCLAIGWLIGGEAIMRAYPWIVFAIIPISTTILENVSPYGSDNLMTPLYVTIVLSSLNLVA